MLASGDGVGSRLSRAKSPSSKVCSTIFMVWVFSGLGFSNSMLFRSGGLF